MRAYWTVFFTICGLAVYVSIDQTVPGVGPPVVVTTIRPPLIVNTKIAVMPPVVQFFDFEGRPLSYGVVTTYRAGTVRPQATYRDVERKIPNSNPIFLDSSGRAILYLTPWRKYRIVVSDKPPYDPSRRVFWSQDGIQGGTWTY